MFGFKVNRKQVNDLDRITKSIENAKDEDEMHDALEDALNELGLDKPWEGDFDDFMNDPSKKLVFE